MGSKKYLEDRCTWFGRMVNLHYQTFYKTIHRTISVSLYFGMSDKMQIFTRPIFNTQTMLLKRFFLTILPIVIYSNIFAQSDTTAKIKVNTEITLATRNIWRGLDYGSSPSIQGTLSLNHDKYEFGAYGTTTLNGTREGYGTWLELFATFKHKQFSFTIDDYFFFNSADSLNNYFEWGNNTTQHFIETRVKWSSDKFGLMAGYAVYKNQSDKTRGLYLEAEYSPTDYLSFVVAGLTSSSYLSFYDDGGITTVGVSGKRTIPVSDNFEMLLKASLLFNPSYNKSVNAPGVGTNPVYFVVYLTL
jgi:hypothetical protein